MTLWVQIVQRLLPLALVLIRDLGSKNAFFQNVYFWGPNWVGGALWYLLNSSKARAPLDKTYWSIGKQNKTMWKSVDCGEVKYQDICSSVSQISRYIGSSVGPHSVFKTSLKVKWHKNRKKFQEVWRLNRSKIKLGQNNNKPQVVLEIEKTLTLTSGSLKSWLGVKVTFSCELVLDTGWDETAQFHI